MFLDCLRLFGRTIVVLENQGVIKASKGKSQCVVNIYWVLQIPFQ